MSLSLSLPRLFSQSHKERPGSSSHVVFQETDHISGLTPGQTQEVLNQISARLRQQADQALTSPPPPRIRR